MSMAAVTMVLLCFFFLFISDSDHFYIFGANAGHEMVAVTMAQENAAAYLCRDSWCEKVPVTICVIIPV